MLNLDHRARLYGLLSEGFSAPSARFHAALSKGAIHADLVRCVRFLGFEKKDSADLRAFEEAGQPSFEEFGRQHLQLFGPAGAPLSPSEETEYGMDSIFMKSQALADIAGFYRAFGLDVSSEAKERADHLAVELEFMRLLVFKEARALEKGDAEAAAICRDAQKKFLSEHLGRWIGLFGRLLRKRAPAPFYRALSNILESFIQGEMADLNVQPKPIVASTKGTVPFGDSPLTNEGCGPCLAPETQT